MLNGLSSNPPLWNLLKAAIYFHGASEAQRAFKQYCQQDSTTKMPKIMPREDLRSEYFNIITLSARLLCRQTHFKVRLHQGDIGNNDGDSIA